VDWVLTPFSAEEETLLEHALPRAVAAVLCFVREGIGPAMNRFNGPWPEPDGAD
jgi:PTH1 family peptidyl-tRNA hydrolase